MLGGLIGAGVSLLAGNYARKKDAAAASALKTKDWKKSIKYQPRLDAKTRQRSRVEDRRDLRSRTQQLESMGINRLTALGVAPAGGVGGAAPKLSAPGGSMQDVVANSFDTFFNQYNAEKDREIEAAKAAELAKLNEERGSETTAPVTQYDVGAVTTAAAAAGVPSQTGAGKLAGGETLFGQKFEGTKDEPRRDVPLTARYRLGNGSEPWTGLNPDAWEIGIGEIFGSGLIHGGAYTAKKVDQAASWLRPRRGKLMPNFATGQLPSGRKAKGGFFSMNLPRAYNYRPPR